MAYRRPPNPYTKYGRRRMRNEIDPEVKAEAEKWGCLIIGAIIIIGFILAAAFGGEEGVASWIKYIGK